MKRLAYAQILDWKKRGMKKPLFMMGARQVGKTYLVREFCENEFDHFIEINLLENENIVEVYRQKSSSEEKLLTLKAIIGQELEDETTIVFIDEIQESKELISELKFFNEKHPRMNIICAGSLLGIMLKKNSKSFPVGKIEFLYMHPMSFEEFLIAFGKEDAIALIRSSYKTNTPLLEPLHEELLLFYKKYLFVGGMPESVENFLLAGADIIKYNNKIIPDIIKSYIEDMSKYIKSTVETMRLEKTYRAIPAELTNEAKKFQYSKIEKGAKKREYETCLDWLLANDLIIKSQRLKHVEKPLKAFQDNDFFKLYLNDSGILCNMMGIQYEEVLLDNLGMYKGALAENYISNVLYSKGILLCYWLSKKNAEVDFIIGNKDGIIPVEVKSGDNAKAKSLNLYMDKYNPPYAIKISSKNFGFTGKKKSVPLYAAFCIEEK